MYSPQAKEAIVLLAIFAFVVITSGLDLVADISHGAGTGHILKEALVVGFSIVAIA